MAKQRLIPSDKRPTVVFERVVNAGQVEDSIGDPSKRERARGVETAIVSRKERIEKFHCVLTGPKRNDPYVWATSDYIKTRIENGDKVVGLKNFDFPASYPKEWADQLRPIVNLVRPFLDGTRDKERDMYEKRIKDLEAKIDAEGKAEDGKATGVREKKSGSGKADGAKAEPSASEGRDDSK